MEKAKLDQEIAKAMQEKIDVQIKKAKLEEQKVKSQQEEVKLKLLALNPKEKQE